MPRDGEEDFGLDALEGVLSDLRAVTVRPATPDVAARHLALMESAALAAVVPSAAPALSRRRAGAADTFWTMPRRVAAAVAAAFVALFGLGGLGMAGALPGPVQDFVATVTEPLGIDMPRSDEAPSPTKGSQNPSSATDPTGPAVTGAPGQTGATPGQSGETPANGSAPPGLTGSTPGQSGEAPGQSGNPSVTAPGQVQNPSATAPGQVQNPSVTAPGQVDNPSATAPGQSGSAPGQSGSAGANGNGNGNAGGASGSAPGRS